MGTHCARLLTFLILCTLAGGCAGKRTRSDVREYLEEATGTSITCVQVPATFVREQPGLASSGRDYVYLAPMVVSRSGQRSYWLWLGVWSTVDRQARDEAASPLRIGPVQIVADDEPMDLDAQSVYSDPAGIRRMPYETPVKPAQEFLVPVTRSQLFRLGHARVLVLTDSPADGTTRLWRGDDRAAAMLRHFADETLGTGPEPVPSASR